MGLPLTFERIWRQRRLKTHGPMYNVLSGNEFFHEFGVRVGCDVYQYFSNEHNFNCEVGDFMPPGLDTGRFELFRSRIAQFLAKNDTVPCKE